LRPEAAGDLALAQVQRAVPAANDPGTAGVQAS
jgi:hypothetical protein